MKSFKTFAIQLKGLIGFLVFTLLGSQIFANPYVLFGTVGNGQTGTSELIIIDQNTGAVEQTIGNIGHFVNGLTYDPITGNLYASTSANDPIAPSSLIIIDTETAAATVVAPFVLGSADAMTLVTTDSTGQMYGWIEANPATEDDLVRIDKNTAAFFQYPDAGISTYAMSLDFNNAGTLYLVNGSSAIYTVDTTTGLPTNVGTSASSIAHHGKFNPVTDQLWAIDEFWTDNPRNIVVLDIPSGTIINTFPTIDNLHTLAFALNLPPHSVTGEQKRNKFLTETEYFNELRFYLVDPIEASGFHIYRNGKLVATLPPTARKYIDHNQKRKKAVEYTVEVIFTDGTTSLPQSVIVQ